MHKNTWFFSLSPFSPLTSQLRDLQNHGRLVSSQIRHGMACHPLSTAGMDITLIYQPISKSDCSLCSSVSSVRRELSLQVLASTSTSKKRVSTRVRVATPLCTRARLSLTVVAAGQPFLTVCFPAISQCLLSGLALTLPRPFEAIPGAVSRHEDRSYGMTRIEITCTACGGHLGHVFKGERYNTPSTSDPFHNHDMRISHNLSSRSQRASLRQFYITEIPRRGG